MVGCGMGGDMPGGDTSSSSGAKPPSLPMAGLVWHGRWMGDGGCLARCGHQSGLC